MMFTVTYSSRLLATCRAVQTFPRKLLAAEVSACCSVAALSFGCPDHSGATRILNFLNCDSHDFAHSDAG
jgi:hypothetical protein